jgi:hypothetical protein
MSFRFLLRQFDGERYDLCVVKRGWKLMRPRDDRLLAAFAEKFPEHAAHVGTCTHKGVMNCQLRTHLRCNVSYLFPAGACDNRVLVCIARTSQSHIPAATESESDVLFSAQLLRLAEPDEVTDAHKQRPKFFE